MGPVRHTYIRSATVPRSHDEVVIATAIAAQASYIVTTDKDLIEDAALTSALAGYNLQAIYPFDFFKLL